MTAAVALLSAVPWVLLPVVVLARARRSRSLDEVSTVAPQPAPLLSVVIPARNEAPNIERCMRSVLATTYPAVEVIVVDDHSTDGTGDLARRQATGDSRLRVATAGELPDGWFGKQWACETGALAAHGEILLFTDADTTHAPDLIVRAVNAMRDRDAALLSVVGAQEMGTFWERVVQPQVFGLLIARYGGTEAVSHTTNPVNAIANGQCVFVRRADYDATGGHRSVRHKVAEDLALAQQFVREGRRIVLILGVAQLSTRMYTSLADLVGGWKKNVYAGGRDSMVGGSLGRALYPAVLAATPLFALWPVCVLFAGALGLLSAPVMLWAAVCVACAVAFWMAGYAFLRLPAWYALLYPLGLLVLLFIVLTALARGERVGWKGREYRAT
jgi:chlorobactene glucosyltransferase